MSAVALAAATTVAAAVGTAAAGALSQEARSRVEQIPARILGLALRRIPEPLRDELAEDWHVEQAVILRETEGLPITRLCRATCFALGLWYAGPQVARALARRESAEPVAEAFVGWAADGSQVVVVTHPEVVSGLTDGGQPRYFADFRRFIVSPRCDAEHSVAVLWHDSVPRWAPGVPDPPDAGDLRLLRLDVSAAIAYFASAHPAPASDAPEAIEDGEQGHND